MQNKLIAFLLAVACVFPSVAKNMRGNTDPVLMTVAGADVRLSEFEYLYKKNSEQQAEPVSLEDYLQMFVNYKLKVRAAIDARCDTLASYRNEFAQFRDELAAPYMRCGAVDDSLAQLTYERMKRNVAIRYMALPVNERALADSLREELVRGADFAKIAKKYSTESNSARNGGYLGYICPGQMPSYAIEDAAFSLPVGAVSEVIPARWGLLIIKVEAERPHPGDVKVRHILKITAGLEPDKAAAKKAEIDSIYSLLKSGADFKEIASRETDDRSGRNNGGDLPWFGPGRMVPAFERASYALADNQMSEPVETSYGYHIILREGHRDLMPYDSLSNAILDRVRSDERSQMAINRTLQLYMDSKKTSVSEKAIAAVHDIIVKCGGINDASREAISKMKHTIFETDAHKVTGEELALQLSMSQSTDVENALSIVDTAIKTLVYDLAREDYVSTLPSREPQYANLLNEYSDGLLLCEISNQQVWSRANTDLEGLERCFVEHREDFKWDCPHYKGYVIAAKSDSVAEAAFLYMLSPDASDGDLSTVLRKKFGTDAKIEKVIAGKGDNAVIDYLAFGGEKPQIKGRWTAYRLFNGKIVEQPEEAYDVRGVVSQRYQQELENEWIADLRSRYKVTIYNKVFDRLRD